MAVFTIADLHLALGEPEKTMEVFPGWERYVTRLEENWRAVVKEEDTVVLAGDLSWAMKLEETLEDFRFIHSLPGTKILLKGNHDLWWSTRSKIDAFLAANGFSSMKVLFNDAYLVSGRSICGSRGWLYNAAGDHDKLIVAREAGRLRMSLEAGKKLGGELTAFLHYPPVFDNMRCQEILDILCEYGVKDCWFGHIHGSLAQKKALAGEADGIRLHLISADYVKFCPVLICP